MNEFFKNGIDPAAVIADRQRLWIEAYRLAAGRNWDKNFDTSEGAKNLAKSAAALAAATVERFDEVFPSDNTAGV